eukprot:3349462-Pleurochrysis_carterae.AAC.1
MAEVGTEGVPPAIWTSAFPGGSGSAARRRCPFGACRASAQSRLRGTSRRRFRGARWRRGGGARWRRGPRGRASNRGAGAGVMVGCEASVGAQLGPRRSCCQVSMFGIVGYRGWMGQGRF